jgi:hypothetical protein
MNLIQIVYTVEFSLCITKHYAMKTHEGVHVHIHAFLTLALVGDEWPASRLCRFTPEKRVSSTHWIVGWEDRRTCIDDMEM